MGQREEKRRSMVDLREVHIGISGTGRVYCGTVKEIGGELQWGDPRIDITDEFLATVLAMFKAAGDSSGGIELKMPNGTTFVVTEKKAATAERKYFDFKPNQNGKGES